MPTTKDVQDARNALHMAEFRERIGARMRERRETLKANDPRWTQEYAARHMPGEVSGTQWARWERGENMPREDTLKAVAKVLGLRLDDLYATPPAAAADDLDDALPYRARDVARMEAMDAKLDAILNHFKIEWLEPDDAMPGSTAALRAAEEAAAKVAPKKPAQSRKRQRT